jgi:hypothetical protein
VIPQPDLKVAEKTHRLTIVEYIVDVKRMLSESGRTPIFTTALYKDAPFPVANKTNTGDVRVHGFYNFLALTMQVYDVF